MPKCYKGCGEMGACHPNQTDEVVRLRRALKRIAKATDPEKGGMNDLNIRPSDSLTINRWAASALEGGRDQ